MQPSSTKPTVQNEDLVQAATKGILCGPKSEQVPSNCAHCPLSHLVKDQRGVLDAISVTYDEWLPIL